MYVCVCFAYAKHFKKHNQGDKHFGGETQLRSGHYGTSVTSQPQSTAQTAEGGQYKKTHMNN